MRNKSLFLYDGDAGADLTYVIIRDDAANVSLRGWLNRMWNLYEPYADSNFRQDLKCGYEIRFWEMYLAYLLIQNGFEIKKLSGAGPEFFVEHNGRKLWFEAICPSDGEGANALPPIPMGIAHDMPEDKLLLRLITSVSEKHKKYRRDLEMQIIHPDDAYILCINTGLIPYSAAEGCIPYMCKAVYGVGNQSVDLNKSTGEVSESYLASRPQVLNANKAAVSTTGFVDSTYSGVSGILYSRVNGQIVIPNNFLSSTTTFIPNLSAINRIDHLLFPFLRACWVEDSQVKFYKPITKLLSTEGNCSV